jgi:hypothetical protein
MHQVGERHCENRISRHQSGLRLTPVIQYLKPNTKALQVTSSVFYLTFQAGHLTNRKQHLHRVPSLREHAPMIYVLLQVFHTQETGNSSGYRRLPDKLRFSEDGSLDFESGSIICSESNAV